MKRKIHVKTYPEWTPNLELADKNTKTIILNIFHLLKKLSRKMEDIKKTHIQPLVMRTSICKIENSLDGINERLDIIGEKN